MRDRRRPARVAGQLAARGERAPSARCPGSGGVPGIARSRSADDGLGQAVHQADRVGVLRPTQHRRGSARPRRARPRTSRPPGRTARRRRGSRGRRAAGSSPSSRRRSSSRRRISACTIDVQRGGGLVGQQQGRPRRERHRDEDALAHPAAELVRVGAPRGAPRRECRRAPSSRSRASGPRARPSPACDWITCAIASPTRRTGLSAVIGSWKTIAMLDPRSACISPVVAARGATASPYVIRPRTAAPRGSSRRMARQVRLLPDPLSPTRPNASPEAIVNETPRTTRPPAAGERRPSRSVDLEAPRLARMDPAHDVGRAVADEAHEEAGHDDRETGEDHHPRGGE